jgi:hypothetical protein
MTIYGKYSFLLLIFLSQLCLQADPLLTRYPSKGKSQEIWISFSIEFLIVVLKLKEFQLISPALSLTNFLLQEFHYIIRCNVQPCVLY